MAEDCGFTNVGSGTRLTGRDAQRADLAQLIAVWTDVHVEITNLLIAGDQYTKEWVMTGVHTGDMPGLPATGKPFRFQGAGVGHIGQRQDRRVNRCFGTSPTSSARSVHSPHPRAREAETTFTGETRHTPETPLRSATIRSSVAKPPSQRGPVSRGQRSGRRRGFPPTTRSAQSAGLPPARWSWTAVTPCRRQHQQSRVPQLMGT